MPALSATPFSSSPVQNFQELQLGNGNLITIATIEKREQLLVDKDENLEPQPECCIYRVPKDLRRMNKQAYTPQVISIGPLHHGHKEFADMEKQKIRYRREFSKRITMQIWQEILNFIEKFEKRIRNCYAETIKLPKLEFIAMILYDAIFIIELFLRNFFGDRNDFLLNKPPIRNALELDLQLLENQLPYFVLQELYTLAFPNNNPEVEEVYPPFLSLSCLFFWDNMCCTIPVESKVKHFTDLRRYAILEMYPEPQFSIGCYLDLPCAIKLQKSGVNFKPYETRSLLDIRFEKKKLWFPCLSVTELQIPSIEIYDRTECVIRNLMALEQCHYPWETHICNYIALMDALVDTEEDVNLLVEAKIISNHMGDNARVAKMFNKLCPHVNLSYAHYYNHTVKDLKAHYSNSWNHTKATLRSTYFSHLWRGTATIAAISLLLLTLIQTICSILQIV